MTTLTGRRPSSCRRCTPGTASPADLPCCPPSPRPRHRTSCSRGPGCGRCPPSSPRFPLLVAAVDLLSPVRSARGVLPVPVPRPGAFGQVRELSPGVEQAQPQRPVLTVRMWPRLAVRLRKAANLDELRRANERRDRDEVVRRQRCAVELLTERQFPVHQQRVSAVVGPVSDPQVEPRVDDICRILDGVLDALAQVVRVELVVVVQERDPRRLDPGTERLHHGPVAGRCRAETTEVHLDRSDNEHPAHVLADRRDGALEQILAAGDRRYDDEHVGLVQVDGLDRRLAHRLPFQYWRNVTPRGVGRLMRLKPNFSAAAATSSEKPGYLVKPGSPQSCTPTIAPSVSSGRITRSSGTRNSNRLSSQANLTLPACPSS